MVEKSCMTRLWISSLHQIANEMGKKIMSFAVPIDKRMEKEPSYQSMEEAGHAQWHDFSLKNTPDLRKKGVIDISKYYA